MYRYFIALAILATLFGVIAGGTWVWTGVALLGVGIIIDTLHTRQTYGVALMKTEKLMQILSAKCSNVLNVTSIHNITMCI